MKTNFDLKDYVVLDEKSPDYGRTRTAIYSRSMGFIRPVSNFNVGKYQEFQDRNTFKENFALTAGARHEELMKEKACM